MTITRTTLLDLPIITSGTETGVWGDITNNGLTQYLDIAIAGMVSLTSSDFTAGALTIALTEGTSGATNIANSSAQYATIKVSSLSSQTRRLQHLLPTGLIGLLICRFDVQPDD
jgi:hypothetical protein